MDGIVNGKIEKSAGTIEFKASVHVDMQDGGTSLMAETFDLTVDYAKIGLIDGKVMIVTIASVYNITFPSGSFAGVNAVEMSSGTYATPSQTTVKMNITTPSGSYPISGAFKYLELGTLS